jgi:hypothetical protein
MVGVCLLFVLPIFGWWLPRSIRFLRNLPGTSGAQAAVSVAVAVIPVAIGFGLLMVLIALLRNPMAYVTNTGVMQESVFRQSPVSFAWKEVDHVYCWLGRDGGVVRITVVATDGRRVEFGKTGGVDCASMYELFQNWDPRSCLAASTAYRAEDWWYRAGAAEYKTITLPYKRATPRFSFFL